MGRALIVDDDPVALEVARESLVSAGFDVDVREEALGTSHWVLENQPEWVLLDVMMPALSGADLARLISRSGRVGVVLYSSKSLRELEDLAVATGAIGFIRKGSTPQLLSAKFLEIVTRARVAHGSAK
ncbi:MAG: response regulator [Polyangiaceae bacterium]